MIPSRIGAVLVVLTILGGDRAFAGGTDISPAATGSHALGQAPDGEPLTEITPARVSDITGEVSFWRPGAHAWERAALNTPLAPGDALATGATGNVEIQVGPRAIVRAAEGTQLGLDHHESGFILFRLTGGHAALDLRGLAPGYAVEVATPHAAFTVEHPGYYHAHVTQDFTVFRAHGGRATMTLAGGAVTPISANQQVVVAGAEAAPVEMSAAPELSAWDRWVRERADRLVEVASARHVAPDVYGAEALDQHGSWRAVEPYGPVWVPAAVPAGWIPYSSGRWIWDPRFGWTWLDDAPWGWAPYHYGRWVFVGNYWAWSPGPVVVRPAYSPALVVFLGGGIGAGRPLCWAPLAWGEPVVPWWGRPGFAGKPWWGGWGGPRVVNNATVHRSPRVDAAHIRQYRHVSVTRAVVGVPAEHFGQGRAEFARISRAQLRDLAPVAPPGARGASATAAPDTARHAPGPAAPHRDHALRNQPPVPTARPGRSEPRAQIAPPARVTRPERADRPFPAPAAPPVPTARPARSEPRVEIAPPARSEPRAQIAPPERITRPERVDRPIPAPAAPTARPVRTEPRAQIAPPARVTRPEHVDRPVPAPAAPTARPARSEPRAQIAPPARITRPEHVDRPAPAPRGDASAARGRPESSASRR